MARYVMDLFRGRSGPLDSRPLVAQSDAEALIEASAIFSALADNPRITGYRLRNPASGSDRIFYEGPTGRAVLPCSPKARSAL
jgi:hypothetical protein